MFSLLFSLIVTKNWVLPSILSGIWLAPFSYVLLALTDPIELGSRGERLGIIGILVASVVVLVSGIAWLYSQNTKAWKEHHEHTIKTILTEREKTQNERKEERAELIRVLKECAVIMANVHTSYESIAKSIDSLRGIVIELERKR